MCYQSVLTNQPVSPSHANYESLYLTHSTQSRYMKSLIVLKCRCATFTEDGCENLSNLYRDISERIWKMSYKLWLILYIIDLFLVRATQEKRRHQAGHKIICGTDPMGFNPISSTQMKDKMACACKYTHMEGAALREDGRLISWLWNTGSFFIYKKFFYYFFGQSITTSSTYVFSTESIHRFQNHCSFQCSQGLLALHPQQQGMCFNMLVK